MPIAKVPRHLESVAAEIGLDWGSTQHELWLLPASATVAERHQLANTPEALHQFLAALGQRFGTQPVAIALEKTRALLVDLLLQYPFVRVYLVHPAAVAHYRQAFGGSRAKSDDGDAQAILHLLHHHRADLPLLTPADPASRHLAALCEERRAAVDQRTKLVQNLRAKLTRYFPQALALVGDDLGSALACAFLGKWPTLPAFQRSTAATVRGFYYAQHCRSEALITARLALKDQAVAASTDPAVVAPLVLAVHGLVRQLRALRTTLAAFDHAIATAFASHPEAALFRHLPGAGPALAPRLLAAFGSDRDRYPTAATLQCYSGIAPVTEQSGHRCWVHFRWQRPRFLHQTFVEFALYSMRFSRWAAAYARYRRAKNPRVSEQVIARALAFKWLRVLHACWAQHTPYDEDRYLATLQRHHAPLCEYLAAV